MPYNTGVQDVSGQLLARGIEGGFNNLASTLEFYAQRKEKKQEEDKFKLGLVKALAPKFADLGYDSKEAMLNDASDTILGRVTGQLKKQGMDEFQQRLAQYARGAAEDTYRQDQRTAEPKFLGDLARYAQPGQLPFDISPEDFDRYALPEGQAGPDFQRIAGAAARTGYNLPPNELDNLIRATAARAPLNEIAVGDLGRPRQVPGMPGAVFIPTWKGGGDLRDAEGAELKARAVKLDDEVIGYRIGKEFKSKADVLAGMGIPDGAKFEPVMVEGKKVEGLYQWRDARGQPHVVHPAAADPFKELLAQLIGGRSPTEKPKPGGLDAAALAQEAYEAINGGADGGKVRERYRKLTGKDLPK